MVTSSASPQATPGDCKTFPSGIQYHSVAAVRPPEDKDLKAGSGDPDNLLSALSKRRMNYSERSFKRTLRFKVNPRPRQPFLSPHFEGWAGSATSRGTGRLRLLPRPRPRSHSARVPAGGCAKCPRRGPAGRRGDGRARRTGRRLPIGARYHSVAAANQRTTRREENGMWSRDRETPHLLFPTPDRAFLTSGSGWSHFKSTSSQKQRHWEWHRWQCLVHHDLEILTQESNPSTQTCL
ncbi:uncharacterized protein LOC128627146 [Artibeus jamaicensis]|uniref:uncharacterized protein LOC128627146 n=1 Tax=Artibeus jamaicensis TaxID=9417 RepID=UPI00235A8337|nr:uncharacterized protein LOC128627146 [Artibeus jamaicensis]